MFNVAVTAIIKRSSDQRFLITKRTANKKRWPNKWTVPGGQLEESDFIGTPTEINNQWYGTLENAIRREVREEVGLEIEEIQFLCDIAVPDTIIISFTANLQDFGRGLEQVPVLQLEECDEYAWVTYEEAKQYDLIDGLLDEIKLA